MNRVNNLTAMHTTDRSHTPKKDQHNASAKTIKETTKPHPTTTPNTYPVALQSRAEMDLQLRDIEYKVDSILRKDDAQFLQLREQAVTLQTKLNEDRVFTADHDL